MMNNTPVKDYLVCMPVLATGAVHWLSVLPTRWVVDSLVRSRIGHSPKHSIILHFLNQSRPSSPSEHRKMEIRGNRKLKPRSQYTGVGILGQGAD